MNYQVYGNELYHHGILGQKWGVRRFQNPDGSLTPAGKKRYYEDGVKKSSRTRRIERTYNSVKRDVDSFDVVKEDLKNKKGRTIYSLKNVKRDQAILRERQNTLGRLLEDSDKRDHARAEWKEDRAAHIATNSSRGGQVVNFLVNGPFGAYTYNSLRASGSGIIEAEIITKVSDMLGPGGVGNITVSSIIGRDEVNRRLNK